MSKLRTFKIQVPAIDEELVIITTATTASKARYRAFLALRDGGYDNIKFGHINVKREPRFDSLNIDKCVNLEFANEMLFEHS